MFNEMPYLINLDAKYTKKPNANYIDPSISYGMDSVTKNPYLSVLDEFAKYPSLAFTHRDLAFLKHLGNMPINRLVILRRFPENTSPGVNLLTSKTTAKPISTVIGWIKEDEAYPSIGFNEEWTTTNKRLDQFLVEMINSEFKIDMGMLAPVPGWAQGFLMNFYNKMGITDFGKNNNFPFGNPNVLNEASTRTSANEGSQGLKTDFSFKFDVIYEQKSIGNLDPGQEMFNILTNLTKMGTSNMETYMIAGNDITNALRAASTSTGDDALQGWVKAADVIITAFSEAITATIGGIADELKNFSKTKTTSSSDTTVTEDGILAASTNILKALGNNIMATTLGKYRWPLRGSIGLMTGEATTPWHITIGHPFKPFLSINNILVEKIDVKWDKEIAYNEFPKELTASINCRLGRSLGKQEILKLFAQSYIRTYTSKK